MKKKALTLFIILALSLMIFGCRNEAEKKPLATKNKQATVITLTDSEQRILASKVSNMTKLVEGVERASVVVVNQEIVKPGLLKKILVSTADSTPKDTRVKNKEKTTKDKDKTNDKTDKSNDKKKDNKDKSGDKTKAQDTKTSAVVKARTSGTDGGVILIIGVSVLENLRADEDKWKETKEIIRQKILASDDRISRVFITNEPEMVSKVDDLAAAILQGRGPENYKEEINDLLKELNTP